MSSTSPSNSRSKLSSEEREANWLLLDKRPLQTEVLAYDPETIAEIRRSTDAELALISQRTASGSAINKETQAFLDSATVMRALSHMAEERFEQGKLDAAAKAVIDAIRWERTADGLYLSGGVSLPRTDPTRLWYLLAEIYVAMGEKELADKTAQKASSTIGELTERPLTEVLNHAGRATGSSPEIESSDAAPPGVIKRFNTWLAAQRRPRTFVILVIVVLGFLFFAGFRAQTLAKNMIDSSSEGVDYLSIAFDEPGDTPSADALLLAAEQYARLRAQLEGWSWIVAMSWALPPAHDQFVVLDRMQILGASLVAAPLSDSDRGHLDERGSVTSICAAAEHLESFDRNMFDQLAKTRAQMMVAVYNATQGACGVSG